MNFLYLILAFSTGFVLAILIAGQKNKQLEIELARLNEKQSVALEKEQSIEIMKEAMKKEFSSLANETLIEKNKDLQEQNQKNLDIQLAPLKERIKEFQTKVEEFNLNGTKNAQGLKEQIDLLVNQSRLVGNQTEKLATAISLNSKSRGTLGEMILEKLLKASGLINKKEDDIRGNYITQTGFRDLNSPTSHKIEPDAVIYISEGDKNIIVDSKAPLVHFIDFENSQDDTEREDFMKKFHQSIADRVKELEHKYDNLEGLNTPEYTLMFVPFESCMHYIYSNYKLVEEANRKNIIIVGPSTLLATLRTVNTMWRQKNQADNIKEIVNLGAGIYDKCQTLIGNLEGLLNNFNTVQKGFEKVFTTLRGRGGLIGRIAKFSELGFNPTNPIEEKYLTECEELETIQA